MPRHSNRYNTARSKVDRHKQYMPAEAVDLMRDGATAKFDETVEVHLSTGVDPRHADQQVRGVVTLPLGQAASCAFCFCQRDGVSLAEESGRDHVGARKIGKRFGEAARC